MKDLTLTITAPITEWCGDCNYQASKSLNGYSGKCPECGSNHIYRDDSSTSFFGISLLSSHKFVCYYCENEFSHE